MSSDLKLFECLRQPGRLKLTKAACAHSWKVEKRNRNPEKTRIFCRNCSVGAMNAGEESIIDSDTHSIVGVCARCLKQSHRFVYGRICISCANRGYEWIKGINARGQVPVRVPPLFPVTIKCRVDSEVMTKRFDNVASILEAEIGVCKKLPGKVYFYRNIEYGGIENFGVTQKPHMYRVNPQQANLF